MTNEKPTIAELETLMAEPTGSIEIQPDGSVKVIDGKPAHAKPEIITLKKALGDTY